MFDWGLVEWSRAQFALTALYHWLFVPFTLGITYMLAIMFTIYYVTGSDFWKKLTRFWARIFAVNFAIGVATGIILEFEFGTNWSNYSWFVGDIFGAPLVVEGLSAFFLETTFLAVLLLGWDRVSRGFQLFSAWMVAVGGSLSAIWILVANAWMQHPTGMQFNPDTMRNEMIDFWAVLGNPTAIVKILHTITTSFALAAVVVIGISSWYLLKGREKKFAYQSIRIASIFGFFAILAGVYIGDLAGKDVAKYQPMKVAAMEGLYHGSTEAPFTPVAWFGSQKTDGTREVYAPLEIPGVLSWLLAGDSQEFIPGIYDLLYGNPEHGIVGAKDRIVSGKIALQSLQQYKDAKKSGNVVVADQSLAIFRQHEVDMGYGYFDEDNLGELVPSVPFLFWAFRYMVALGFFLMFYMAYTYWLARREILEHYPSLLKFALFMIPATYLGSELGWAVAEVGRQPWLVYHILPTKVGVSAASIGTVRAIFFGFLTIFTLLLIAALRIALHEIHEGPKIDEKDTHPKGSDDEEGGQIVQKTRTTSADTGVMLDPVVSPPARKTPVRKPAPKKAPAKKIASETTPPTKKPPTKKTAPKRTSTKKDVG